MALSRKLYFWMGLALLLVLALGSRFYLLDLKSLHHDEAVNGWFVTEIWNNGFFRYDPTNYHGPVFFYLLQAMDLISGGLDLARLRFVPALFSVGVIFLGFFFWKKNPLSAWVFALLALFSPASLFFGRSGIHEMVFVFSQILMAFAIYEFLERDRVRGIQVFLIGLLMSLSLKETFVFPVAGFVLAASVVYFRALYLSSSHWFDADEKRVGLRWVFGCFIAWLVIYTGFFQNPAGAPDFFKAFLPWAKTGVGHGGHEKPFFYFIELMLRHETVGVLLFFAALVSFRWMSQVTRYFLVVALFQVLAYSVIPYKTPWCVISILVFMHFSVALAIRDILGKWPKRIKIFSGLAALAIAGMAVKVPEIIRLNYQSPVWHEHDYVYVQSTDELTKFLKTVSDALDEDPSLSARPVDIILSESWPFPWALKLFHQRRFYSVKNPWRAVDRPILVLAEKSIEDQIESEIPDRYIKTSLLVRGGNEEINIYWDGEVFTK